MSEIAWNFKAKTALLLVSGDIAKAQFDDIKTGYGYGWHTFRRNEWNIEGNIEEDIKEDADA